MTRDWLDEVEAQADSTVPYYLPRMIAEIRSLRSLLQQSRERVEGWDTLSEVLNAGGMTDPAFLIGMVKAEVERAAAQEQEIARLRAENFELTGRIANALL